MVPFTRATHSGIALFLTLGVPQKGVRACDVRGPVDCTFQDMSNANVHLAQVSMPIIKTGFALAYRTGVCKGPGFWFAVFLSLLSGYQP